LALQFSPADLIDRALAGPSSDVTDWASRDMLDGFCDDMVTPADKGILLGHICEDQKHTGPPIIFGMHLLSGQVTGLIIMSHGFNHTSPIFQMIDSTLQKVAKSGENSSNWLRQSYHKN
jgi:hypothetical protein